MGVFEKRIAGIEKMTMLDFPEKLACILFYNGCRVCHCPYCYNKALWKGDESLAMPSDDVVKFLESRKGKLDGVVLSGGECTVWGERLIEDIRWLRERGFLVKIDTNGTNPELLLKMLTEGLVDYVALDVKCPESKFKVFYRSEGEYRNFVKSLDILMCHDVPFETRTTVHPDLISEEDVNEILRLLKVVGYRGTHYLQFFFNKMGEEYLDGKLEKNPRLFDLGKIIHYDISVGLRNHKNTTFGELN